MANHPLRKLPVGSKEGRLWLRDPVRAAMTTTRKAYVSASDVYMPLRLLAQRSGENVSQPYSQILWLYAAINARADTISQVRLRAWSRGRDNDLVLVEDSHPWEKLLRRPNPTMNGFDFISAMVTTWDLYGEVMFFLINQPDGSFDGASPPKEIWVVPNPSEWEEVVDNQVVVGWRGPSGLLVSARQLRLMKSWNPYRSKRGHSPLFPLQRTMESDHTSRLFMENYMKNGADPGGVLITDGDLDPEYRAELRASWEDRHRGALKAGRIAVLQQGLRYEPIKVSVADMNLEPFRHLTMDEILGAYRVPKQEVGMIEDVNRATAGVIRRTWWHNSLIPWTRRCSRFFTALIAENPAGSRVIEADFDYSKVEALQEDFADKIVKATGLKELGYPLNEINVRVGLGMEEQAHGDTVLVVPNLVPIEEVINTPGAFLPLKQTDKPAERTLKVRAWSHHYELAFRHPASVKMHAAIRSYYKKVEREQVAAIDAWARKEFADGIVRDINFGERSARKLVLSKKRLAELMRGVTVRPVAEITKGALNLLGRQIGGFKIIQPDLDTPWIKQILAQRLKLLGGLGAEDAETIRDLLLKQAREIGFTSVNELRKTVRKVVRGIGHARSLAIARTETGSLANGVRFEAMSKEDVPRHEWSTAGDDVVRPTGRKTVVVGAGNHRVLNGVIVKVGEVFPNGMRFPQDSAVNNAAESVNCRCVALPVID